VNVDVIERVGEQPPDLGDLATILGQVRLPVRAGRPGKRRRFPQQIGRARDGEPRRDRVAQATAVGAMPALDETRRLGQAAIEDGTRIDGRVVGDPIHHHLAHDGPDPVRFGRPERGVQARLVDGAVDHRGGRARGGERSPRRRREAFRGRLVETAFEREDVALEPRQQV
jgi:hypothetical protein